ncbi:MAG: FecR domain-containing protein [Bacteroidetes bacterium]|nr:FecR domain-containing protein [Bacteroidota bacterium]
MEYNDLEDLVFSRSFRNWVIKRDTPDAGFWENWVSRHPEKAELVQHAKAIIYALQLNLRPLSEEEVDLEIGRTLLRMRDGQIGRGTREGDSAGRDWREGEGRGRRWRSLKDDFGAKGRVRRSSKAWGIAGVIVALVMMIWVIEIYIHRHQRDQLRSFIARNENKEMRQGASDTGMVLLLPDSSRVRLKGKSRLYYSKILGQRREVFLEGEAFFDIKHDAVRPFYVYTHTVVAKVLGTSFTVKAWPAEAQAVVSVHTGKISVYKKEESNGLVVTPNQELLYEGDGDRLKKSLVKQPELVQARDSALAFSGTPVGEVFSRLQEVYGIQIVYDEELVKGRTLSATLNEGNFYEKINVICKAIGASWEAIDGNVVISPDKK